jgi:glycosyltransferase involved in cell wall biosynthesis
MPLPLALSVFVIAKNEVNRIGDTLRAVRDLTDDLVVIDSGSTDGTVELATSLGARVLYHAWDGYGAQKRFAEEQCRHDWVLNLDADEIALPDLVEEIRGLFARREGPCRDAFEIGIAEAFPGESRPHRLAHTIWAVRLYRRSRGRYSASPVHDRVELDRGTTVGRLHTKLHHFSVRSLGEQLEKLNRYSSQQAADLDARGISIPTMRVFFELPVAFLKAYVGRRHFVHGTYGFLTAMNYAIFRHLRLAKHYERRSARKAAGGRGAGEETLPDASQVHLVSESHRRNPT